MIKRFFRSLILNKKLNEKTGIWEYGYEYAHLKEGYPYTAFPNEKGEWPEEHEIFEWRWLHCNYYPMQKFYNWYLKLFS